MTDSPLGIRPRVNAQFFAVSVRVESGESKWYHTDVFEDVNGRSRDAPFEKSKISLKEGFETVDYCQD